MARSIVAGSASWQLAFIVATSRHPPARLTSTSGRCFRSEADRLEVRGEPLERRGRERAD